MSIINHDQVDHLWSQKKVNAGGKKIHEDWRFLISTLLLEFPNVGKTTLHKIFSEN